MKYRFACSEGKWGLCQQNELKWTVFPFSLCCVNHFAYCWTYAGHGNINVFQCLNLRTFWWLFSDKKTWLRLFCKIYTLQFKSVGLERCMYQVSSLHTGTFPTAFKQARVSPLLKKPALNPALLENYRPVSLLPFIAKSLERVVFNQLSLFLAQNNILDNNQSGFRSGHSTETALLSVTEALRLARAASKSSVLILLDLSAAFDTVNHQILMSILRKMGISGTALLWFESYLSDRSFRVSWRGEVSKSQLLATGVPQSSVLGPLLFSIYMSSLGSVIQKHGFSYHCYADDTQLYFSFQPDDPTVTARIAACLSDISSWMMDHHLQLNLAKTELLVFSANPSLHHNFSIQLVSSTITPSRTARNLGVVIDDQLSFTDHIATTARSCRFALYNIRKIRPFLSEQAAQLLAKLLFSPEWTIVMLSWRAFPHVLSSLCNWSRMQQPEWSLMSRKKLTLPLSSSGYTGYQ